MRLIVLMEMPEINYTLIARVKSNDEVYEYVCAWCYDSESKTWGQGHYFSELTEAMKYLNDMALPH